MADKKKFGERMFEVINGKVPRVLGVLAKECEDCDPFEARVVCGLVLEALVSGRKV